MPNSIFYPLLLIIAVIVAIAAYTAAHPSKYITTLTAETSQWSANCVLPSHLYVRGEAQMRCMVYGVDSIKDVKMAESPYVKMTKKTRAYTVPLASDYRGHINNVTCPASLCFTATIVGVKVTPRPPFSWEPIVAPVYLSLDSQDGANKLEIGGMQVFADYFGE